MNSLPLGKYFGIHVYVHWTFGLLLFFVAYRGWQMPGDFHTRLWAAGEEVLLLLAVFFCVTLHEFGHALMARQFGIRTHDIILWPLGGLARLEATRWTPTSELLIAIAGPLVNVAIALVLACVFFVQSLLDTTPQATVPVEDMSFLAKMLIINVGLVLFNMIPAFPMDGGRVLRALVGYFATPLTATRIAARVGQVFAVLFVVAAVLMNDLLLLPIGILVFLAGQAELNMIRAMSNGQIPPEQLAPDGAPRNEPTQRSSGQTSGDLYYGGYELPPSSLPQTNAPPTNMLGEKSPQHTPGPRDHDALA